MDNSGEWPKNLQKPPNGENKDNKDFNNNKSKYEIPGVYSDVETRRTIYNELEIPESAPGEHRRIPVVDRDAKFTKFSDEWFAQRQILDGEREKGLLLADQLFVPDELEGRNPFEILGVAEGDFVEAHKSYRMLMRTLHPDVIDNTINNVIDKIMGGSEGALRQFKEFAGVFSKWQKRRPKILTEEKLSILSQAEKQNYENAYKAWESEKPSKGIIETIRQEIKASAEKKARVLNAAWGQIKKGLSFENIIGAMAHWDTSHGESDHFTSLGMNFEMYHLHPHQTVDLEADAEIYRDLDFRVTDDGELVLEKAKPAYLLFAFGHDKSLRIYEDFRESYRLKHLFAFLEHRDGRTIHQALLSDIAEEFELTGFQITTLQKLLKENVDAKKICEELEIIAPFNLPREYGPGAVLLDSVFNDLVVGHTLENARIDQLTKAGYTPEILTALTNFIISEKPRIEENIRDEENRMIYSRVRETGESFAQVRNQKQPEPSTNFGKYSPQNDFTNRIKSRLRELQKRPNKFIETIQDIQKGPIYTTVEDQTPGYRVGVEFARDGLRLVLPAEDKFDDYDFSQVIEVFFNQTDLGIMKEIAYGRSIKGTPARAITGKNK